MLQIGKVLKSNGTEGGVLIGFRDIDPEDILTEEPVYIYFDGLPVPFFFTSFVPKGGDKALARLSSVDSLRDAEEIVGREVYADYFEEIDEGQGPEALTGWKVNGEGVVAGWLDIPGNPCLEIRLPDGRERIIPFHEDLVLNIDKKRREITMNIPEGLLD